MDLSDHPPLVRTRPLVAFTRADLVEMKPTRWLIESWLVQDSLAGLVGASGVGKSFLALDWACRVASGTPWCGMPVSQGAVFYLAGEGQQGLRKRITAWEKFNEVCLDGRPLYLADSLPFLTDHDQAEGTVAAIESIEDEAFFNSAGSEPALVVIDTVARAMGGSNENSAEDIGRLISAMDWIRARWGACVLAVHHTGHSAKGRARGSSAFMAALDSEFILQQVSKPKPSSKKIILSTSKAKDWEKGKPLVLAKQVVPVQIQREDGSLLKDTSIVLEADQEAQDRVAKLGAAMAMAEEGKSHKDIGAALGVGKSTISRWLSSADEE